MVKAVEVFRLSAIRNRELELEAERAREQAERDRVDMQIAAEAEAEARMNKATGTLAQALRKLAAGDLLCEVTQAFAPQFEDLRHDFNRWVVQLRQALVGVGQSVTTVTVEHPKFLQHRMDTCRSAPSSRPPRLKRDGRCTGTDHSKCDSHVQTLRFGPQRDEARTRKGKSIR